LPAERGDRRSGGGSHPVSLTHLRSLLYELRPKGPKLYYKVLIPKIEITDREALRNKANDLVATWAPTNQSGWYWVCREDDRVYGFENGRIAVLFTNYCTNQGIGFRPEYPTESWTAAPTGPQEKRPQSCYAPGRGPLVCRRAGNPRLPNWLNVFRSFILDL
jgi:hypothetical protein